LDFRWLGDISKRGLDTKSLSLDFRWLDDISKCGLDTESLLGAAEETFGS
jgi:hypothetical protein